jgi:hypothetical protein
MKFVRAYGRWFDRAARSNWGIVMLVAAGIVWGLALHIPPFE